MSMDDVEALRQTVLLASLPQVVFDGWTDTALRAGAEAAGLPASEGTRAFPGGPIEAIEYFNRWADAKMVEAMEAMDTEAMRTRDKVAAAIRARLELVAPHREAVRRALNIVSLPFNAPLSLRMLGRTVDAVWLAAGDRSNDFNWYTKRGLLAGVYSATVLYWLNDKSEDCADTWSFLDRRIEDVMRAGGFIGRFTKALGDFPRGLGPGGFGPRRGPGRGRGGPSMAGRR